jgi:enterochelin esterase-like enzyme
MNKVILFAAIFFLTHASAAAQDALIAPKGFDSLRLNIPHGKIDTVFYTSKIVGTQRRALIYTPPGISKRAKYPVLYLLHGIGGDEYEWLKNANPQVILDNLYSEKKIVPMIVVMPNGRAMKDDRAVGNVFDSAKVKAFETFERDLLDDLIPFVEKKFPVNKERRHRAIAGLSMGGGQSLNFGLNNLDKFAWVGGFSSAPNTKAPAVLIPDAARVKSQLNLLWISCGVDDNLMSISQRTHDYLVERSVPHVFYVEPGGHDFKVWKNDLYMFSQLLFEQVDASTFSKYNVLGSAASSNVRNAKYPRVLSDNRVIFRVKAPDAHTLQVNLGKKYDMVKDKDGFWQVTTDSLSEGFHYYSLLIDGVAVADPSSESYYGMGRMTSGVEIPIRGENNYMIRDVPHGEIRMKRYYSAVLNGWRNLYIYTPPAYDEDVNKRYPVLYLLHGGGEDERGWATQGKTDLILDNLIADGKAKHMLVVMMDGNTGSPGFGEQFLRIFEAELRQSVIPFVEKNYRAQTDAESRALAGLSMGGLQTLYAGLYNPSMFSSLGVFSSGWLPNQQSISDRQYDYLKKNSSAIKSVRLWISMGGKEDIAYDNCQAMLRKFDELGIKYTYSERQGGHAWPVWRNNLSVFATTLFK